jgi:hypothetical protein
MPYTHGPGDLMRLRTSVIGRPNLEVGTARQVVLVIY